MARFLIGDQSEVLVDRGFPEPLLPPSTRRGRVAILHQPDVKVLAERVADAIGPRLEPELIELAPGEDAKTLEAVGAVYEQLAALELGRSDTIVTVGGGAASDSGGFVAATWLRGVEVVHVPTTLLAAVDASIGGKTGLNLAGKNLVGVFWHPSRVVVDLDILEGLTDELLRQGAAEAIKAGLLGAPGILDAYHAVGLSASMETVVTPAIRVKAEIVTEDFTEQGRRAWLNLGHTIGHGIEFAAGVSHGEAVAVGLVAAAAISKRRLDFPDTDLVIETLNQVGLPIRAPEVDRDRVLDLISLDKKRDETGLRMVLLESIGHPQLVNVARDDLEFGLAALGL